jgi:hypothetical protein
MVIAATRDSRAAWSAWHDDEAFRETRERLDATHAERSEIMWYEVLADVRAP